jgi:hypothetical protein
MWSSLHAASADAAAQKATLDLINHRAQPATLVVCIGRFIAHRAVVFKSQPMSV